MSPCISLYLPYICPTYLGVHLELGLSAVDGLVRVRARVRARVRVRVRA
jgi:hypothetical protein